MTLTELDTMRVRKIVAQHLDLDVSNVLLHHRLVSDLGADSLDCVEVAMALEDTFELYTLELPESNDPSVQDFINQLLAVKAN